MIVIYIQYLTTFVIKVRNEILVLKQGFLIKI